MAALKALFHLVESLVTFITNDGLEMIVLCCGTLLELRSGELRSVGEKLEPTD